MFETRDSLTLLVSRSHASSSLINGHPIYSTQHTALDKHLQNLPNMASSSNADTVQERELRQCYRLAFGRFFHNNMHEEAKVRPSPARQNVLLPVLTTCAQQHISLAFSSILDISMTELFDFFHAENYDGLRNHIRKQNFKKSENASLACDAIQEAAEVLLKYGRTVEGNDMSGFAQQVWAHAEDMWNRGY